MARRALFVATGIVVVAGLAFALLAFPTRYKCLGDDLTFTTSKTFAEHTCVSGVTGDVVADNRIAPRAAILAVVVIAATILLRVATRDSDDVPKGPEGIE